MKTYNFTATHRKAIYSVMMELGLALVSTRKQIENGTLLFEDNGYLYGFYESGYCRRFVPTDAGHSTAQKVNGIEYAMYQLNRTYMENCIYQHIDGTVYKCRRKRRVLIGPMEQLGIVTAAIVRWRDKNHF